MTGGGALFRMTGGGALFRMTGGGALFRMTGGGALFRMTGGGEGDTCISHQDWGEGGCSWERGCEGAEEAGWSALGGMPGDE